MPYIGLPNSAFRKHATICDTFVCLSVKMINGFSRSCPTRSIIVMVAVSCNRFFFARRARRESMASALKFALSVLLFVTRLNRMSAAITCTSSASELLSLCSTSRMTPPLIRVSPTEALMVRFIKVPIALTVSSPSPSHDSAIKGSCTPFWVMGSLLSSFRLRFRRDPTISIRCWLPAALVRSSSDKRSTTPVLSIRRRLPGVYVVW
mmetsp:Transcript_4815/g.11155  ORF Transcript_4815/g.11155 Transcript_4815/m.11155 type:complete len:207 (+) Transcript_4815:658-1278(+)